jgi:DNA-binding XRE family transcriptional regulator
VQFFCTVNIEIVFFSNIVHIESRKEAETMKTKRKEILGDLLRRERVIRRISQETLGEVVDVGKTTISAYERGVASPDIEKLDLMCAFMGVDYLDLLREAQEIYKRGKTE